MEREGAALGIFLTLENPTEPMLNEARSAGIYRSVTYQEEYPRLQILTIAELLQGAKVRLPPKHRLPLEQHGKQIEESTKPPDQHNMGL
jgi:site-specific DNA-methyltransferase (adenine-specific)